MTDEAKKIMDSVLTCCTGANCVGCDFKAYRDDCTERMGKAAADLIERLSAELEKTKQERDAAVKDMHELGMCCYSCKHNTENKPCQQCDLQYSGWEWRGVCEENSGGTV